MLFGVFVTVAVLTLSPAPPAARPSPAAGVVRRQRDDALRLPPTDPNALYSLRARKRFAAYLRFRLLELREEHLARAADAIERRIPVSQLLQGP